MISATGMPAVPPRAARRDQSTGMRPAFRESGFVMALLVMASPLAAQDLEPRAYSASPIGANFVAVSYVRSSGSVPTRDARFRSTCTEARLDRQRSLRNRNGGRFSLVRA
jgi:hypothetical protein